MKQRHKVTQKWPIQTVGAYKSLKRTGKLLKKSPDYCYHVFDPEFDTFEHFNLFLVSVKCLKGDSIPLHLNAENNLLEQKIQQRLKLS